MKSDKGASASHGTKRLWLSVLTVCVLGAVTVCCSLGTGVGYAVIRVIEDRRTPPPPVPPEELLLPISQFPKGWRVEPFRDYSLRSISKLFPLAYDLAGKDYTLRRTGAGAPVGSQASHIVVRYRTEKSAHRDYLYVGGTDYLADLEPWLPMTDWAYKSPYADEYRLKFVIQDLLGKPGGRCYFIARHGRYILRFSVHAYPEDMTQEQVKSLVVAIDETFAGLSETQGSSE